MVFIHTNEIKTVRFELYVRVMKILKLLFKNVKSSEEHVSVNLIKIYLNTEGYTKYFEI